MEATVLNRLGEAYLADREAGGARQLHEAALMLARENRDLYEEARAHEGLSWALEAAGDGRQGRRHRRHALGMYEAMGACDAERLKGEVAAGGGPHARDEDPALQAAMGPGASAAQG